MKPELTYKPGSRTFVPKEQQGVPFLSCEGLEKTGIVHQGFSTRLGGVSKGCYSTMNISTSRGDDPAAIRENQRRIAKAIGIEPESMVYTHQVHDTRVARVGRNDCGTCIPETDGLITNETGVCLVTFFADCVPLFFIDRKNRAIGLSHSGWRGTVGRMGEVTLRRMAEEFGTRSEDVTAAIAPSICQDCYEVSEDVVEQFRRAFDERLWQDIFYEKGRGKYQLNLWKANEYVLLEAGIKRENLFVTTICTHCNPQILFSHRSTGNQRGNLSAFLALKQE